MKFWNVFIKNPFIRTFLIAVIIIVILSGAVLWWLDIYTRHGQAVIVPDVKGLKVEDAVTFLESKKLRYSIVDSVYNKHIPSGGIVETIPVAGSKVKENRIIFITVNASGVPFLLVPDVKEQSQRQALAMLKAVGFSNIKVEYKPAAYKELVLGLEYRGQQLSGGEKIPADANLVLEVSSGTIEHDYNFEDSTGFEEDINAEDSWF